MRAIGSMTVLVASLIAAQVAAAACETPQSCLEAIGASQRDTRVLSARFVQTKRLSLLTEPLISTGRFAFRQPGELLWELDTPRVTVRIDKSGVHIPDVPAAQYADLAPFSGMMRELSAVFTGSWDRVEASFTVTVMPEPNVVRVSLVPRNPEWQRMFRAMELSFLRPDLLIHTIRLDERLGDSVEIAFSDIHRNDAVAAAVLDTAP